jgi:hypothetical protein
VLRRVAKLAVVVTVAAPGFSREIADQDVARWAKAGGVTALIEAAWTEGEATERQISVSDDDITGAMAPPHDGLSTADRRYEARVTLLDAALKAPIQQAAAQSVTQEQIDEYVRAHPKLLPERRQVRLIASTNLARARRVEAALGRGLTWKVAAKRYAKRDVSNVLAAPETLGPSLYAAILRAPVHRVVRHGLAVFEVISIPPRRPLPIAQQKAQAWELLAGEAQQQATAEFEQAMRAKWRPRTTCATPESAKDFCSNSPTG